MEDPLDFHPPLDGFRFVDVIGRGGFGLVKLARHLASGKYVAVKILLRDGSPSCPLSAQGEADILRSLRHDNIVRLLEERHAGKHLFLVMELATKGSLQSYVFEQGGLAEAEARTLFGQALAAVSYCHGQRVAHRDLKLGNLLLDEHMTVKLADFGLSLRLEQGTLVRGFWGTPEYCAPEVFLGEDYDALKADVWSLGVVLFAMLAAALPFHGKDTDKLRDRVLCGWYALPRAVSPALQDLLSWLLTVNALRRPSAEDARTHWWFSPSQEAAEEDEEDKEDEEGTVTLLQPLGVPRDPEAREYLEGLGLLPGTGTEGSPGRRPHGPASLPKSSQSGEHHPIEDDGLCVISVSCDSMAVDVSSTQSDSSKASSQPQQQWSPAPSAAPEPASKASSSSPSARSPAPSAAPDSSEVSSQPQQQWSPAPSAAPEPASKVSSSSPSARSPAPSAAPDSSEVSSQPQQQCSPAPSTTPEPASKASSSSPSASSPAPSAAPDSSTASSQPQQQWSPAPSATPDSSKASSQPQQQWSPAPSAAPEPASKASSSSPSARSPAPSAAPDSSEVSSQPQQQWSPAPSAAPEPASKASSSSPSARSPAPSAAPDSSEVSSQPQQQWSPAPSAAPEPASKVSSSSPSARSCGDLTEPEATTAAREPNGTGPTATAATADTTASAQGKRQGRRGVGRRILRFLLRACCILPSRGSSSGSCCCRVAPK